MREGLEYVIAAYAVSGITLAIWFAMIITKLRRNPPAAYRGSDAAGTRPGSPAPAAPRQEAGTSV